MLRFFIFRRESVLQLKRIDELLGLSADEIIFRPEHRDFVKSRRGQDEAGPVRAMHGQLQIDVARRILIFEP